MPEAIFLTHHHYHHVGGVKRAVKTPPANDGLWTAENAKTSGATHLAGDGDTIRVFRRNLLFGYAGHTLGHASVTLATLTILRRHVVSWWLVDCLKARHHRCNVVTL